MAIDVMNEVIAIILNLIIVMNYDQPAKEKSRELIWGHVISSLTHKRNQSTIVNPEIINEFTIRALSHIEEFIDASTFKQLAYNSDWEEFHNSVYQNRKASELRVAFFCGPEPINDIKHLLSRGIRQENIWGFELNREYYNNAKVELSNQGIYINLFQGNLHEFIRATPQKFDIVYLDFTNSLLSKDKNLLLLIDSLFSSALISDLSTLIINTCYPDKEKQNIEFLSRYFEYKKLIHRDLYGSKKGEKFHESLQVHGIYGDEVFKTIKSKFEKSYSEFSSSIIDLFSNIISPLNRITKLTTLHKKIFDLGKIEDAINRFEKIDLAEYDIGELGGYDLIMSADNYGYWHFIMNVINEKKPLSHFFNTKLNNEKFTPFELVKFYSLHHSIEEGYYDAFSKEVLDTVLRIQENTI